MLKKHAASLSTARVWAISPPRPLIQTQAAAFWRLEEYGITDSMLHAFDSIGAFTLAIDYHIRGKPCGLGLGAIYTARTAVQQRLLLLPASEELDIPPSSSTKPNIYECCRLAALIYGVAVVYPIPNSYLVFEQLVQRLKTAIEVLDIKKFGIDLSGVLLWMVVLGGIAALDTPERSWFVSQLAFIVRTLDIEKWVEIENILETFLWLESACSEGGQLLWNEALLVSYSVPLGYP
jgi:Fungal specific transcription factor domain